MVVSLDGGRTITIQLFGIRGQEINKIPIMARLFFRVSNSKNRVQGYGSIFRVSYMTPKAQIYLILIRITHIYDFYDFMQKVGRVGGY